MMYSSEYDASGMRCIVLDNTANKTWDVVLHTAYDTLATFSMCDELLYRTLSDVTELPLTYLVTQCEPYKNSADLFYALQFRYQRLQAKDRNGSIEEVLKRANKSYSKDGFIL